MQLNVQMEKPSNILRKLTIRVPAETVTKRLERGFIEVQKTAKIKGFRPGQVPISVVKQYYGEDVRHRVLHDLIDESYREALREQKVQAVGAPRIETPDHKTGEGAHDHALKDGQELSYTATVEVLPEIEVKGYTGLSLSQGKVEITDKDVELILNNLMESQAQLIPVTGGLALADGTPSSRPVQKADFVDMNFSGGTVEEDGKVKERPGMKGTRMIEIGSGSLIPGFEDNLVGMRKGDTKTFRVKFPDEFPEAELAGEDAEFTVTVNEVKEKKLPELNEEFAKQAGYEGVEDMRKKAQEHLTREKTEEVDRKLRSDLLQALIEKNAFECPAALIQAQTRALAQDVAENLKQQGFNDDMIKQAVAQELENLKKRAENQVRASLLLEAIAKKENVEVKPEEIDAEITKIATSMKSEEAKLRDFYQSHPDRKEDLIFRMREERTVKFLLEKAKIKKEK